MDAVIAIKEFGDEYCGRYLAGGHKICVRKQPEASPAWLTRLTTRY